DYLKIIAIEPRLDRTSGINVKKTWRFETQINNEYRPKTAGVLHQDLVRTDCRSFRLITSADPVNEVSLLQEYETLRGSQTARDPSVAPLFGAIALQQEGENMQPTRGRLSGKPGGKLVFRSINHFNEAGQGVLENLRWYRLSSWILHFFGFFRPRYIIDAICD